MAAPQISMGRLAGVLFAVCFCSALSLAWLDGQTKPVIQRNQADKARKARLGVLPEGTVKLDQEKKEDGDGNLFIEVDLSSDWPGSGSDLARILDAKQEAAQSIQVFRGYDAGGKVTGFAFAQELPDGYSGSIAFMMGIRYDAEIDAFRMTGAKVLVHKETPGLGANISVVSYEEEKAAESEKRVPIPDFLKRYRDRDVDGMVLKKDGGGADAIDAMTAATITSRAFTNATRRILEMANRNKDRFLNPPPSSGEGRG